MKNIRDSIKENEKEKIAKEKEKVLLLKDNIIELEYQENLIKGRSEKVEIPKSLKINLFEHQEEGVLKMQSLYKSSKINGLLLCDDMGLGKTIQILTFLAWLKDDCATYPGVKRK